MQPLSFTPLLKRIRWGGRRLETVLGKPLGPGHDYAESWEICDHGEDQTVVDGGPFAGWTLHRLVGEQAAALLGVHAGIEQFPLLIKHLDANDRLSVQVHPDDAQAQSRGPELRGKTESWVIVDAAPGACVYAGLKPHVDRSLLAEALRQGTVEHCLHRVEVRAGDCLFIPAGTVHAIGEGVLLAEVQQSSDLTFRLFDWNRLGTDGLPRPLHVDDSLACTDFDRGPVSPVEPRVVFEGPAARDELLVDCPYFVIHRHTASEPRAFPAAVRCRILMLLEGALTISGAGDDRALSRGQTLLIPAAAPALTLLPGERAVWLEVFWR